MRKFYKDVPAQGSLKPRTHSCAIDRSVRLPNRYCDAEARFTHSVCEDTVANSHHSTPSNPGRAGCPACFFSVCWRGGQR